ncbi:MAG: DUF4982 domain-containing protein [Limisphaerales bacterium]
MTEMIRQKYNHPAVFFWGIFNEITLSGGPISTNLVSQLAQLTAQEDSTRPSVAAANSADNDPTTIYSQLLAFNKYFGWYNGASSDFGPWADNFHATYPNRAIGVSEYGAGANIYQHGEDPVNEPANAGPYHPEEYQNLYHESHWQQMKARPYLWCKFIWNLCDFAADGRNEGSAPGRNDKGLVTYDRQIRKDAFYWYKANWTIEPMVYITGHTFTNRLTNNITAKVYANCDSVELLVDGVSQGSATSTNCIFTWPVTLRPGTNVVEAIGTKNGTNVTDSLIWMIPVPPPTAVIINPATPTIYLNSPNVTLPLSAIAIDNQSKFIAIADFRLEPDQRAGCGCFWRYQCIEHNREFQRGWNLQSGISSHQRNNDDHRRFDCCRRRCAVWPRHSSCAMLLTTPILARPRRAIRAAEGWMRLCKCSAGLVASPIFTGRQIPASPD